MYIKKFKVQKTDFLIERIICRFGLFPVQHSSTINKPFQSCSISFRYKMKFCCALIILYTHEFARAVMTCWMHMYLVFRRLIHQVKISSKAFSHSDLRRTETVLSEWATVIFNMVGNIDEDVKNLDPFLQLRLYCL